MKRTDPKVLEFWKKHFIESINKSIKISEEMREREETSKEDEKHYKQIKELKKK